MQGKFEQYVVGWAEGRGNNLAKSKNRTESWSSLKKILKEPAVTMESRQQFDRMPKDEQDKLKAVNGWISGAQCKDGHRSLRNVLPRDMLTIDVDYAPASILDEIELGLTPISQYEAFWHSSRRHTVEEPRVRLFMPMKRKVDVDEYTAIVRFIGWKLDHEMNLVDVVSYRGAQMMFKPSCSKNDRKIFFAYEQFGALLDPDAILAEFEAIFGDWRNFANLPKHPNEDLRKRADKAEDPRSKRGPVGVFCRTYDIFDAMEKFLPGVYIPGDENSGHPRYTYAGSTSSNGAIVYDNGMFMYSHHGHDPICDMNVNAFDLVRVHLFGESDSKAKEGMTPTDMPSYKALVDLLKTDKEYAKTRVSEKFEVGSMFEDAGVEAQEFTDGDDNADLHASGRDSGDSDDERPGDDDSRSGGGADTGSADDGSGDGDGLFAEVEPEQPDAPSAKTEAPPRSKTVGGRPKPSEKRTPRENWFLGDLQFTENAEIKSTLHNVATIIQNDPRLINAIRFNEFDKNVVIARDIRPRITTAPNVIVRDKKNGDRWQDHHDMTVRAVLESPHNAEKLQGYGMRPTKADLIDGIELAARITPFHPIRDYLLTQKWDGKPRLDTFLIRYLDLEDNDYHRQVSRLTIVASVTRIFEPGHKFDYAPILEGWTGIGKSWLIMALYSEDWFGELSAKLDEKQRVAEEITGKWGIELPELSGFHKSDHNSAKAFMRRTVDDVRMAYDRRVSEFPRVCVCWGTTNDKKYLKDPTGNRSYWPVVTKRREYIDIQGINAERDQIWAEAVHAYFELRDQFPNETLPLTLQGSAAQAEALRLQGEARTEETYEIWAQAILEWLETPITFTQFAQEIGAVVHAQFGEHLADGVDDDTLVLRTVFTREQAIKHALNKQHGVVTDAATTQNIGKAMQMLPGWGRDVQNSDNRRRIMGSPQRRWVVRESAIHADILKGYSIYQGDDAEDDFDVV
jgi:predicted P-loop ATPase